MLEVYSFQKTASEQLARCPFPTSEVQGSHRVEARGRVAVIPSLECRQCRPLGEGRLVSRSDQEGSSTVSMHEPQKAHYGAVPASGSDHVVFRDRWAVLLIFITVLIRSMKAR